MIWSGPRGRQSLPRGAVTGSVVLHGIVLFGLVLGSALTTPRPIAQTYQVRLVAAADNSAPVRLKPQPAAVAETEHKPPPPEPSPDPKPETEVPTVVNEPPPPEPSREPSRGPEDGDDEVDVRLDGARFMDPAYLQNIIRQVHRHWRPPQGNRGLSAELVFVIETDGSVSSIDWIQKSGDLAFDLEAQGAIEAAEQRKAFGPLPEAYPHDRLRVTFFFDPARR